MINILSNLSLVWLLLWGIAAHIVLLEQLWAWIDEKILQNIFSLVTAFYVSLIGFAVTEIASVSFIVLLAQRAITFIH